MTILGFELAVPALGLGLLRGMSYALLAVGLVLVYRNSKLVNFAHGEIAAGAAILLWVAVDAGAPYWAAFPAALATGALLAAAAVSVAGVIGFVGLMTPHILRLFLGSEHRRLLPAVVVGGAAFMVLADLAARTILAPEEVPVGALTALLGGPFFLYLLRRERAQAASRG